MKSWACGLVLAASAAVSSWAPTASAQPSAPNAGEQIYQQRCKSCHEGGAERAPTPADLARRSKDDIVNALTSGIMAPMAAGLTQADKEAVAGYLTAAKTPAPPAAAGRGDVEMPQIAITGGPKTTDPMCKGPAPAIKSAVGDWSSMGVDDRSSRFQRHPGLTAAEAPKLKLKWAFSMAGGGQPAVVGDWLWVTNRSGKFYALDAKSGCVRWVVSDLVSRTTPVVIRSPISPSGWATFIGQSDRLVRAFDAQTGKELWRSPELESHKISLLTGSPVVAGDKLLVPISSIEEAAAMSRSYVCCTFRGSLAALDIKTGKMLWKTPTISEPLQKSRESEGKTLTGPAGAAVWAAPSLDLKRGLVYIVTGDSYTDVPTIGPDSVMAIEIATGKIRWQHQVTQKDNFVMGCGPASKSGNCPTPLGPDVDFGATPILMTLKGGQQVLVAGQKSGMAYGFDPDNGKLIWQQRLGEGSALGGIEWGIGADDRKVYIPVSDFGQVASEGRPMRPGAPAQAPGRPGLNAVDPATGKVIWFTPAPKAPCHYASDGARESRCIRSQSAAPAIIPGLVFEGALDGWFRAYDAATGKIVWEYSTTAQTYETLNGIKGQPGGGIDGMGPTVANGMVYIVSGNNGAARVGSNGVNVLLAFSVDGK
ncbi:PQQ-binding-like beta-propeller repeat protein [Phenylobacterium sp.]|uniref:outer membrane protein assembly factor BamB family protein n=1 Tax=Phenylobacterium sp. TaxID=1871053 RepID=UPI002E0EE802